MNDEKNLSIKVNPTSNTAVTTLIMLANAHYEKALEILEQMGVEKEEIFHGVDHILRALWYNDKTGNYESYSKQRAIRCIKTAIRYFWRMNPDDYKKEVPT